MKLTCITNGAGLAFTARSNAPAKRSSSTGRKSSLLLLEEEEEEEVVRLPLPFLHRNHFIGGGSGADKGHGVHPSCLELLPLLLLLLPTSAGSGRINASLSNACHEEEEEEDDDDDDEDESRGTPILPTIQRSRRCVSEEWLISMESQRRPRPPPALPIRTLIPSPPPLPPPPPPPSVKWYAVSHRSSFTTTLSSNTLPPTPAAMPSLPSSPSPPLPLLPQSAASPRTRIGTSHLNTHTAASDDSRGTERACEDDENDEEEDDDEEEEGALYPSIPTALCAFLMTFSSCSEDDDRPIASSVSTAALTEGRELLGIATLATHCIVRRAALGTLALALPPLPSPSPLPE